MSQLVPIDINSYGPHRFTLQSACGGRPGDEERQAAVAPNARACQQWREPRINEEKFEEK